MAFVFFVLARYFPILPYGNPDKLVLAAVFSTWVLFANSNNTLRQKLYFPGAYLVATRSYALYLIHPEVLALLKHFGTNLPFIIYFGFALAGSLTAAEALYRLIEKPFMDAREKFPFSKTKKALESEGIASDSPKPYTTNLI